MTSALAIFVYIAKREILEQIAAFIFALALAPTIFDSLETYLTIYIRIDQVNMSTRTWISNTGPWIKPRARLKQDEAFVIGWLVTI